MAAKPTPSNHGQPSACPIMFFSIPDVAKALGIGQTTAWALIRDGKLPAARLGRRTLVPAQALTDFAISLTSAKR